MPLQASLHLGLWLSSKGLRRRLCLCRLRPSNGSSPVSGERAFPRVGHVWHWNSLKPWRLQYPIYSIESIGSAGMSHGVFCTKQQLFCNSLLSSASLRYAYIPIVLRRVLMWSLNCLTPEVSLLKAFRTKQSSCSLNMRIFALLIGSFGCRRDCF